MISDVTDPSREFFDDFSFPQWLNPGAGRWFGAADDAAASRWLR